MREPLAGPVGSAYSHGQAVTRATSTVLEATEAGTHVPLRTPRCVGSAAIAVPNVGRRKEGKDMGLVLWLIAAVLVIVGIVQLFQGQIIFGILLIVAGCAVGPGGWSVIKRRA